MSYLRAIIATLRLDKITKGIKYLITGDVLTIASYYFMIIFNMIMLWCVMYVFRWLTFISCI